MSDVWRMMIVGAVNGLILGLAGLHITEHPLKFILLAFVLGVVRAWDVDHAAKQPPPE